MQKNFTISYPTPEIAKLTLDRPEKRNALSSEMLSGIIATLKQIGEEQTVQIVILQGNGSGFCSGIDLKEAAISFDKATEMFSQVVELITCIRTLPQIVVAVPHGFAVGGGVALIAASDLVVAESDLKICCPEVKRGFDPVLLFPLLRRKLADSALRELLLTGLPITANRAKEIGLLQYVVSRDEQETFSLNLTKEMLTADAEAVQNAKLMFLANENTQFGLPLVEELRFSLHAHLMSWQSETAQNRVAKFLKT
ncbi:MAG: enoyl-CoA hydratase/isomerase family protein [Thermoguttaceae bacterium]